jgi:hypothetical protein
VPRPKAHAGHRLREGVVTTPEQNARIEIDQWLAAAGWSVQNLSQANLHASQGVALREFPS